jgi:nitroreductase
METLTALKNRRSVRSFDSRPIPQDAIERLVDCGRLAATARNVQPWEFVAVTSRQTLDTLASVCENGKFLSQSPACIAVFCQDTKYYLEDGCAAMQNILNAAFDQGLASCWVAGDKKEYAEKVRQLLQAPDGYKLVGIAALGFAKTTAQIPSKRSLKEVLHWETF